MNQIRKWCYSIPFVLIGLGFIPLTKIHWYALTITIISFVFAYKNYKYWDSKNKKQKVAKIK